jgi:hypothetical protein
MQEQFAVVFRDAGVEAAGSLELGPDRLLLRGRAGSKNVDLHVPYTDVLEVRVGSGPSERLNGYRTLVLERADMPPLQVAPLGVALLPEIADLLASSPFRSSRAASVAPGSCWRKARRSTRPRSGSRDTRSISPRTRPCSSSVAGTYGRTWARQSAIRPCGEQESRGSAASPDRPRSSRCRSFVSRTLPPTAGPPHPRRPARRDHGTDGSQGGLAPKRLV